MTDLKSILTLPHGLASFNSKEIYYIISNLFGLGACGGENSIEKERLYLNFEKESFIRFLFICTTPILPDRLAEPETEVYYGEFDKSFEEIEIYGGAVPSEISRADRRQQPDGFRFSELFSKSQRIMIKPVRLIQGLLNIIENTDVKTREVNGTFALCSNDKTLDYFHLRFNLYGNLDENEDSHKNFSGIYHLIAMPATTIEKEHNMRSTLIFDYELTESNEYKIYSEEIDGLEMTNWEHQDKLQSNRNDNEKQRATI